MLALALLLTAQAAPIAPLGLAAAYAEDAAVRGLRPPGEIRAALRAAAPALAACVADEAGVVVIDVALLAAGYVDRTAVVDHVGGGVDDACAIAALRALALKDRGKEPPTHAVVRLVVSPGGASPPAGTSPRDLDEALVGQRDDIARCLGRARESEKTPDLGGTVLARFTVAGDGSVADVDAKDGTLKSESARACVVDAVHGAHLRGGRDAAVRVVWPIAIDRAPVISKRHVSAWQAGTLFDFLGCANAFSTAP
ncbi:MAG TPA: hypothetical protein VGO62_15250 [Myxococcota bacterium]